MNNTRLPYVMVVVALLAGFFIAKYFYQPATHNREESVIIVEQLKSVSKLITIEAYYNELYTYQQYHKFKWRPFNKKAIIRVKARVLAGCNLEALKYNVDEKAHIISISKMPEPTVLAIEHDLDYYDLSQGIFNKFSVDDYNKMNGKAKELILQKANESNLLKEVEQKTATLLSNLQATASSMGWKLVIK